MAGGLKFGVVPLAALLCFGYASTPPHPPGVIALTADGSPVVDPVTGAQALAEMDAFLGRVLK